MKPRFQILGYPDQSEGDSEQQLCTFRLTRSRDTLCLFIASVSEVARPLDVNASMNWRIVKVTSSRIHVSLLAINCNSDEKIRRVLCEVPEGEETDSGRSIAEEGGVFLHISDELARSAFSSGLADLPVIKLPNLSRYKSEQRFTKTVLDEKTVEIIEEFARSRNRISSQRPTLQTAKLSELLCLITQHSAGWSPPRHVAVKLSNRDVRALANLREYLHHADAGGMTLFDLASKFGLNRNKLAHGFKHQFGVTVMTYRRKSQLLKALELLSKTDRQIRDVAEEVGFQYPCNFSTAFKEEFGYCPKEVRRRDSSQVPYSVCQVPDCLTQQSNKSLSQNLELRHNILC